ncbi:phosphotransferase enzyme family protein [Aspergillus neoniger CBS 115656]|uniref:Phosphotransferase enzyme family protein n=1 Tax=Aspergillus neoniger (strain CBS 115656) TaxID=1448310 RepID=A0A318YVD5_ASPNB|nr:phosphotransferase enzyme family protein [Aspergillus neoniger CBS 115656]PYH37967.1 phosphotransferase enzyme family protein [Aspergillus neoniger CBS 115656]
MKIFPESSFFQEGRAPALPSPAEVRDLNLKTGNVAATNLNYPPSVIIPSLGLVVKYGLSVSIVEAQTQIMLREEFQGRIPIPEIFGWTEDNGQKFIYMSLIEGDTLADRWGGLSDDEKRAICEGLHRFVGLLRTLEQDTRDKYVGNLDKNPLTDIYVTDRPELVGPFQGEDAVKQLQDAFGIEIDDDIVSPIVFTHNDLLPPNIMITPGPDPKVAALVDWAQSGWYPAYWECCKCRKVQMNAEWFCNEFQDEWRNMYLPLILDPVDDETIYYPWVYFVMTKGM